MQSPPGRFSTEMMDDMVERMGYQPAFPRKRLCTTDDGQHPVLPCFIPASQPNGTIKVDDVRPQLIRTVIFYRKLKPDHP
jgi:hypothetical protein